MCRAVAYLGQPIELANLLHRPKNGLVAQSVDPKQLHMLNLAGFGMCAWTEPDEDPLEYRSTAVPVYDRNLASLARHVQSHCWLGHIRGIPYRPGASFGAANLHPFRHPGERLTLAHNGDLAGFERLRPALAARMDLDRALAVRGTTDSEWIYALLLDVLGSDEVTMASLESALRRTIAVIREARAEVGIDTSSSMNLFITDGTTMAVVRYTFDFGRYALDPQKVHEANTRYLSLWYATGGTFEPDERGHWGLTRTEAQAATLVCASEPLSADPSSWVEVPEYSVLMARRDGDVVNLHTASLDA